MFTLPPLPFAKDALAPRISAETIEFHYGKHHQTYVDNLNKLVNGTPFANQTLEQIIPQAQGPIFNNAAQVWNHSFYWNCLSPTPVQPAADLVAGLNAAFGSVDKFREQFTQAAVTLFGSGWAWLVKRADGKLAIVQTSNAATPMTSGEKALLTCDVWEHAYYIDYRNARAKYVENYWPLVNWDFVMQNFKRA